MSKNRMTFDELDSYISLINKAKTLDEISNTLHRQIKKFGFECFTYWLQWPSQEAKKPIFISTYPKQFIDHDMVGRFSTERNTPFVWADISKELIITRIQKNIFDDSRSVGLVSGGSIPIHGPNQIKAIFSVSNYLNNEDFEKLFNYQKHELQIIATYSHEKIIKLNIENTLIRITLRSDVLYDE